VATAPVLDGALTEEVWQRAQHIANFTQREQDEGKPATERTEVAAVYTASTLYFGIWCYDAHPELLIAQEMKRDFRHYSEDRFEIIIDTYRDRRNGYLFILNPNGARKDILITDEGRGYNADWNGVWDVAVRVTDRGWFAEVEIPFSTLKFPARERQTWGINFERGIARKQEQVLWQGWSRDYDLEMVSQAGVLTGIEGISGGHLLEFKPYTLGGVQQGAGASVPDRVGRIGGDLYYLITSNFKLNLTLRPDFAQIESDRVQINLTRFSLYYPEKREFFLEGKGAFTFNLGRAARTFYSRRIGIQGLREVPITGGVRILGKQAGTEVGALTMRTAATGSGSAARYAVVRVKRDIWGKSNVGFITTSRRTADTTNTVYGVDFHYSTSSLFGDKNLRLGSALALSRSGVPARDEHNLGYQIYLSLPNDFVEYDLALYVIQRNFDPAVGFLRRTNYKHLYTELQFNPRPTFLPWIWQTEIKPLDIDVYWSDDTNQLESVGTEFRPLGFGTKSGEWFEYNFQRFYDRLDEPFEIHQGIVIPVGSYWYTRHEIQFSTFSGRRISLRNEFSTGGYYTGNRLQNEVYLKLNVNKHLNLSVDYAWNRLDFGDGSFTTRETGGRIDYAFTPKLYTSLYSQWNNEDEEIVMNFRLTWIPKVGSDFYLAVNHTVDTGRPTWRRVDTAILAKFVFRLAR
jgi:hypothetical protein